jgi:hypothetical protein
VLQPALAHRLGFDEPGAARRLLDRFSNHTENVLRAATCAAASPTRLSGNMVLAR